MLRILPLVSPLLIFSFGGGVFLSLSCDRGPQRRIPLLPLCVFFQASESKEVLEPKRLLMATSLLRFVLFLGPPQEAPMFRRAGLPF